MIKIENTEVVGWEHAIRGCRNPLNSWARSDSEWTVMNQSDYELGYDPNYEYVIGQNDHDLMMRLRNAGTDHRKFMRMITVYVDITAPLYMLKELDQYKVGVTSNSCSTMHRIHAKEFTLDDFSHEHLSARSIEVLEDIIDILNRYRYLYLNGGEDFISDNDCIDYEPKNKHVWYQLIQLLPSSYNQKRTYCMNYEVLANIYKSRKNHKLDEWREFCKWIESLPYSEIITG